VQPRRFVFCLQNHDQVGNRALGERLHHQIDPAAYRAASVLLLCAPATPLLFMGQEWAATTPFLYFTDHPEALGKLVTEGRRTEFSRFAAFADAAAPERIPDPQDVTTFVASHLLWSEVIREPHASTLRLYRRLLAIRRREPALRGEGFSACALTESTLLLRHDAEDGPSLLAVIQMKGSSEIRLANLDPLAGLDVSSWQLMFTTEDPSFAPDPKPPDIEFQGGGLTIGFTRPSAVLLSVRRGAGGVRVHPHQVSA
jgi:maltooligosyltrehalose trehalohydrolase